MQNVMHFKPQNALTFETVTAYRLQFYKQLLADKTGHICLDLLEVTHCDSAGLALLIEAKRLCKKYNKSLNIQAMSEKTQALAVFCGIGAILSSADLGVFEVC